MVKRDPGLPEGRDNWILMSYRQYSAFLRTEEGRRREHDFIRIDSCGDEDCVIMVECTGKLAKEMRRDSERTRYLERERRQVQRRAGEDVPLEEILEQEEEERYAEYLTDPAGDVEEKVFARMDREQVQKAVGALDKEKGDLVRSLFLDKNETTETQYAFRNGMSWSEVRGRRKEALKELERLLKNGKSDV